MKINLTDLDPTKDLNEITDFLLDNKIWIIVNNLSDKLPHNEYELKDLETVWDSLRLLLIFKMC